MRREVYINQVGKDGEKLIDREGETTLLSRDGERKLQDKGGEASLDARKGEKVWWTGTET